MSEYRFDEGLRRARTTRTREPETKVRENYGPPARRARSVGRRDYYDDEYDDYYPAPRGRPHSYREDAYYSDEYDRPPKRERRKSKVEGFLEDAGLGGIVGTVLGKSRSKSRDRSRGREDRYGHYDRYDDRSRSRGRHGKSERKWQQAAQAALVAGAVEAFRSRKDPGPWTGEKGTRIATAALGAAGIDGLVDRDPNRKSKRHTAEAVIGGLVANRLANGPRDRSGSRGRSRSRSMSRARSLFGRSQSRGRSVGGEGGGAIKNLAGAGAIAAAGKAIYDRVRSKSRGRRRSGSSSSEDSYVPSRGRRYGRSRDGGPADYSGPAPGNMRSSSMSSESTTDMEYQRKKMRGKELLTAGLATVATIHAAHGVYSSMVASENRRKLVSEGEMSPEEARKRKSKNMLQDAAAVGIAALGIKSAFSEWKEMNEQRHLVHDLETKRRKKRKARERAAQQQREQQIQNQRLLLSNGSANPTGTAAPPAGYGYGASTYADANPYSAGNLPPPPMGARY